MVLLRGQSRSFPLAAQLPVPKEAERATQGSRSGLFSASALTRGVATRAWPPGLRGGPQPVGLPVLEPHMAIAFHANCIELW